MANLILKNAPFIKSNVQYIAHENFQEHFVISIGGVETNVFLRRHHIDPLTGKSTGERNLEPEKTLIESLNPGDQLDLELTSWDWNIGNRSGIKYYLLRIDGVKKS